MAIRSGRSGREVADPGTAAVLTRGQAWFLAGLKAPWPFKIRKMSEPTPDARYAALAVASRRRLLGALQSAGEPLDVAALATAAGLHVTTARFHLDVLERAGLVRRATARESRPGRPRALYIATAAPGLDGGHRQLAGVLVAALAADPRTGPRWAEQAGRRWADDQVPAGQGQSWDEGTRQVGGLFGRLGFAPRVVDDSQQRHLELDACPFRDLARAHPEVVCSVHLGLLRGALSRLQVPLAEQAGLRPFVGPDLCIADVLVPPGSEQARRLPAARP
jgi:predicted ArsR family transcriptional regulator